MRTLFTFLLLSLCLCGTQVFAQWEYWEADDMPTASADTAWHFEQEADGATVMFSTIIEDPDIPGNKLLKFDEPNGDGRETFANNWEADPDIGATLVFRMKALEVGAYDRDWDIYLYNSAYRERLVSNSGVEVKFDKSKAAMNFDTSDWHIYRITIIDGIIDLFIDEEPVSLLFTSGEADAGNLFRFGDLGSSSIGTLYDWIAWDISGAYPPGEGDPLPTVLTGFATSVQEATEALPAKFELMQNYPNPFNPTTNILFTLAGKSDVTLDIYDLNGRLIRSLMNRSKPAGQHRVLWDGLDMYGSSVPSGSYIYKLTAEGVVRTKKMTLLK